MTPAPKRPRITREEVIAILSNHSDLHVFQGSRTQAAIRYAIRALKREQKAATKKKETKR